MSESSATTSSGSTQLEADVAIVGLGPVGLFLAIMLGRKGHKVVGIDRWPTPYPLPRAVTFDHEIARILNSLGIDSDNDPSIDFHDSIYQWRNSAGDTLMEVDWISKAQDGWRNRYWFSQPALEERFRQIASSLPNVTLLQGYEITEISQDEDFVYMSGARSEVVDGVATAIATGEKIALQTRFAIGSDGANSFVRRSLGLEMTDLQFYYDWLVVDMHPHVRQTYSPAHYQVCDPIRPTTVVPGGPGKRRWEFMALPGESREELGKPETTWKLLKPFGLTPENSTLERAVVWRFQAKYLEEWRLGRICLAGDAAHLMPPFAGEGMCAGLRDGVNLAWRLDLILRGIADQDLLDSYGSERKPHAKWYINFSVDLGKVICVVDPEEARARDAQMKEEHLLQSQKGPISPHRAVLGSGVWREEDKEAGLPAIQGHVAYRGVTGRFDEVVTRGWSLISLHDAPGGLTSAQSVILNSIGGGAYSIGKADSGADVIDLESVYLSWMHMKGIQHLLVRPDFYVALTAKDEAGLQSGFDELVMALKLNTLAKA